MNPTKDEKGKTPQEEMPEPAIKAAAESAEIKTERDEIREGALEATDKLQVNATYQELEARIPEVAAMKGYDQKSDFHSLTLDEHTKQLVRNLEKDKYVSIHPKFDLILLAAKLHDLGKTVEGEEGWQVHPKDPEKRQYAGHEKQSEKMLREILPEYFELSKNDLELVARLAGLHASALMLVRNFSENNQPKGKGLKAYDKFITQVDEIPGVMTLEEKMKIVFALNKADKGAGVNEQSDRNDEKVQTIIKRTERDIGVLNELEKALPALIEAIKGRKAGDQKAGIVFEGDVYKYKKPEEKEKVEIPQKLKPLGRILKTKIRDVAAIYTRLEKVAGNEKAIQGIVNGVLKNKLGLDDEQIKAVLDTL